MITNLTNNTYSDVRIAVRMMIVSPKGYAGYEPAFNSAVTWLGYLLKRGGSTMGFTGLVADLYTPINHDAITTHYDKLFYNHSLCTCWSFRDGYAFTNNKVF